MILIRPILELVVNNYKDLNIWLVSNKRFRSLFEFNDQIKFIGIDFKNGGGDIFQIYNQIKKRKI